MDSPKEKHSRHPFSTSIIVARHLIKWNGTMSIRSSRRNSIKIFLFGFAFGIVFISTFLNAYVGIFYNLNCITRIPSDDMPSESIADYLFGRSGNHSTAVDIATPSLAIVSFSSLPST
eukprot:scaffold234121_cov30-Cyclotella_meneghiniana.AAC.3